MGEWCRLAVRFPGGSGMGELLQDGPRVPRALVPGERCSVRSLGQRKLFPESLGSRVV